MQTSVVIAPKAWLRCPGGNHAFRDGTHEECCAKRGGTNERTENRSPGAAEEAISVTATVARKEFGRILDLVAQGRRVIITRYGVAAAVMMPLGRFDVSTAADTAMLDTLTAEFDALLESIQTAEAHAAMDGMFNASPKQVDRILATAPQGKR